MEKDSGEAEGVGWGWGLYQLRKNYSRTKQDVWQVQAPAFFIFLNKIRNFSRPNVAREKV